MKKSIKQIIAVVTIAAVLVIGLTACGTNNGGGIETSKCEIGFIIDETVMEENTTNEAIWNGLIEYGEESKVAHNYFVPNEISTEGIMQSVQEAVDSGAKIIIMKNGISEKAFAKVQKKYPKIKFILLAGDYTRLKNKPEKNGMVINFNELQAGFLAGYAAVTDGHENMGIIMENKNEAQNSYASGFIQGADAAASGQGFTNVSVMCSDVSKKATDKTAAVTKIAKKQTESGIDMIFVTGSSEIVAAVADAAGSGNIIIGTNIDRSKVANNVNASAVKCFKNAIEYGADLYYDKKFPGERSLCLGLENDAVGIVPEKLNFKKFDEDIYEKICDRIVKGSVKINNKGKNDPLKTRTDIVEIHKL